MGCRGLTWTADLLCVRFVGLSIHCLPELGELSKLQHPTSRLDAACREDSWIIALWPFQTVQIIQPISSLVQMHGHHGEMQVATRLRGECNCTHFWKPLDYIIDPFSYKYKNQKLSARSNSTIVPHISTVSSNLIQCKWSLVAYPRVFQPPSTTSLRPNDPSCLLFSPCSPTSARNETKYFHQPSKPAWMP